MNQLRFSALFSPFFFPIVLLLTFRALVVEHAVRPDADVKLAGHKAVFVFVPRGQLTFVLAHARVPVVEF